MTRRIAVHLSATTQSSPGTHWGVFTGFASKNPNACAETLPVVSATSLKCTSAQLPRAVAACGPENRYLGNHDPGRMVGNPEVFRTRSSNGTEKAHTFSLEIPYSVGCGWGCAPVDRGMIDRCNRVLRGYLLRARGFMEARSQVGGNSRRALSRS
jgi:hypothetical protein